MQAMYKTYVFRKTPLYHSHRLSDGNLLCSAYVTSTDEVGFPPHESFGYINNYKINC